MNRRLSIAESAAKYILAEFGILSPDKIDVEAIAYAKGAYIEYAPLKGAAGRLVRDEKCGIIRVDSNIRNERQQRFTGAHELGHFVLHEKNRNASCRAEDMLAWCRTSKKEQEANEFAAELLMPYELFLNSCDRKELNLANLERLAATFKTTLTATAVRYVDIGPHVCALTQSFKGTIKWCHPAPDFPFKLLESGMRVQPGSGAYEYFSGRMTVPESEEVLADRWLEDDRINKAWTIREITIPMPSYESALSILWIEPRSRLDLCAADEY